MTVTGFQRAEGFAIFALCLVLYPFFELSWWWFAIFILVPDIFMLGYARGSRVGALVYNAGHTFVVPALLALVALWQQNAFLLVAAIIWAAHIGLDRGCGYGLKLDAGFHHTHLGDLKKR